MAMASSRDFVVLLRREEGKEEHLLLCLSTVDVAGMSKVKLRNVKKRKDGSGFLTLHPQCFPPPLITIIK